eukprot:XP_017945596.1 PREDICTED: uncharacterized protein LOC101734434 [Xenopus tropicalis]
MVAWKEHTVIKEESQRLPPNVMEHRIPMEPGSSYMVTVRALTAAGPGEASLWLSGTPKATGASDSYVRVSLVLKPLFLTVLILILLCVTVREKWEQRGAGISLYLVPPGISLYLVPPGISLYLVPPGYQSVSRAPGYQSVSRAPGYQPVSRAPGYQPVSRAPGYQSVSRAPGYQSVSRAPGYQSVSRAPGYQSVSRPITCKWNGNHSNWNVPVPCIEQCPKSALPRVTNVQLVPPQDYYLPNTGVSVRCPGGYKPSRDRLICKAEQDKSVWDVTAPIHCVAQCAKPTAPGIRSLSLSKDFYDPRESVTVTCAPGYQPVSRAPGYQSVSRAPGYQSVSRAPGYQSVSRAPGYQSVSRAPGYQPVSRAPGYQPVSRAPGYQSVSGAITCKWNGAHSNWNVPVPCIAFQVNVRRVTPTSISLQWECQPGPCHSYWGISVSCRAGGQINGSTEIHTVTGGATVSGLEPHTEYIITISGDSRGKRTDLERRTIRTEQSAPGKPDFTQYPSINNNNNNTLKWQLSETHGVLTGYQLNISAHREYNITFSETESHWLGPNVMEFNMELRHGTNYTVTLRGFTVSGPGEPAVWAHETPIGEPPEPINKWIGVANQAAFFLLHSVPSQHGPISLIFSPPPHSLSLLEFLL